MTSTKRNEASLDGYLHETDLARLRGVTDRALRAERARGEGPPYVKLNRRVFYPEQDFRDWLRSQVRRPVRSAYGAGAHA